MEIFKEFKQSDVNDIIANINIVAPYYGSSHISSFVNKIIYLDDYIKFKEMADVIALEDRFACYGKIKNKIIIFIFHLIPFYNQHIIDLGGF